MQRNTADRRLRSPLRQQKTGWIAQSSSEAQLNPKIRAKNLEHNKSAAQNFSNDFLGREDKAEYAATEGADDDMKVSLGL